MITIAYDYTSQGVSLKNTTLARIAKFFDDQHKEFVDKSVLVHRRTVFEILSYLIMLTPVDTGRLRGSWSVFLDKYGQAKRYKKLLTRKSAVQGERKTEGKGFDPGAFEEGKALGSIIDELFSTTVTTNVKYAVYVEEATGFLTRAKMWGDKQYEDNFQKFFDAAVRQGMIPPEDDPSVDPNREGQLP